jgi:GTP cyclohydrolase II
VPAGDLLAYPLELAASLTKVAEVAVPLDAAKDARLIAFRALDQGIEHMAILVGNPAGRRRRWCACIPNASPATCWAACAAIAGRSCSGAIARMAAEGAGGAAVSQRRKGAASG